MARVVVCGYMIRHPVAGNLLAFFQHVLGLARLGHEVAYIEESGWPYSSYDPSTRQWLDHPETGLRIVRDLLAMHGMSAPVLFVNRDTGRIDGADLEELKGILRSADLLLNIGGVCWLPEFQLCRRRAMIDMDPLFTQAGKFGADVLSQFHLHFSYGTNIGRPGCTIPTAGVEWLPTVPPVVMELWRNDDPGEGAPFTTICNWGAYGGITCNGEHFGQKDEEFLRLLTLPGRTSQRLELAISGASEEVRATLRRAGWLVRDAGEEISTDLATYQSYITQSRGEFSVAKNAYVKTRSGWFSDRSVCYLAAGKPAVLQDTGFTDWLPADRGLLAFTTEAEAAERLERVQADYALHRDAARSLAAEYFSHEIVLPRLLDAALGKTSAFATPLPAGSET